MELFGHEGRAWGEMTLGDLHQTSWRAGLLARATFMALGHEALRWDAKSEAQAMLEHLWALGFRPRAHSDRDVADVK